MRYFQGQLLSLTGVIADIVVLTAIGLLAYRLTHIHKMINQYPWLYERQGFLVLSGKNQYLNKGDLLIHYLSTLTMLKMQVRKTDPCYQPNPEESAS